MKSFGLGHKKIEVEVPWDFETDKEIAVQLGRLHGHNGTFRICYVVSTGEIHISQPTEPMAGLGSMVKEMEQR